MTTTSKLCSAIARVSQIAAEVRRVPENVRSVQDAARERGHRGGERASPSPDRGEAMNPRLALALASGAALVAVAGSPAAAPVESASGSAHWTIPLPNDFGVEVVNRTLSFN